MIPSFRSTPINYSIKPIYVICHMSTSQWSPWIKYSTFCYWVCRKQKLSVNIAISLSQQNHWLCSDSLFLRGEPSGQSWWFPGKLQPTCFLNHLDFIVSIWSIIEGIRNSFFFFSLLIFFWISLVHLMSSIHTRWESLMQRHMQAKRKSKYSKKVNQYPSMRNSHSI